MAKPSSHPDTTESMKAQFRIGMLVTSSETIAPELWRIVDLEGKAAYLKPISLGATERQAPLADLRRYQIKCTDQVFRGEELVQVVHILNPRSNDPYRYLVRHGDTESEAKESELRVSVESASPNPIDMAAQFDAAPAELVSARAELLHAYFEATARSIGIVGYNGARMLPIPHQIFAARHALSFGRTRFLLADEVGLGKTVEAGLIVTTLRKYFPAWRVGFFVPESLTVQWAFEMYGKFGKSIYRIEEAEGFDLEEGEDDPGVILAHERAAGWSKSKKNRPEILVVDEAHRVLQDEATYKALVKMSKDAHAVLLLTATPTADDAGNLLQLLRLLDPEAFDHIQSPQQLTELLGKQQAVEGLLDALRDTREDGGQLLERWDNLGFEDEAVSAGMLALRVDATDALRRRRLAAVITDRYHPGARILRYQRKFLAMDNEMAERVEEPVDYRLTSEEAKVRGLLDDWIAALRETEVRAESPWRTAAMALVQAVMSSPLAVLEWLRARSGDLQPHAGVSADPVRRRIPLLHELKGFDGEAEILAELERAAVRWQRRCLSQDMKRRDLAQLARYQALEKQLKHLLDDEEDHRYLVFTSFECNVKPLHLLLNRALGEDIEVFSISAEMEWRERERNAFAFQEARGRAVLISDDLGGEGRNFQFTHGLFHFDLPPAAWVVEQRIGRLDRVGRSPVLDVDSQVLVAPDGLDEAIYDFLRDGVNVFNESIAPVEDLIDEVTRRLLDGIIVNGADGARALAEPIGRELEKRRERVEGELLGRRDSGVEEIKRLALVLRDNDELKALGRCAVRYTRLLGSMVDDQSGRLTITVGSHHPLNSITGVLSEMQGLFDREQAVRHERLEFFSPGHPFVRALAHGSVLESVDRAAFIEREGIDRPALVLSYRVHLPQEFLEAVKSLPEDIQPAALCRAGNLFGTTMHREVIDVDGNPVDGEEKDAYVRPFDKRSDTSHHRGRAIVERLPAGWQALSHGLEAKARKRLEEWAAAEVAAKTPELAASLAEILTRQFGMEYALEAQIDALLFELEPLSVELDSVSVILPSATIIPMEDLTDE